MTPSPAGKALRQAKHLCHPRCHGRRRNGGSGSTFPVAGVAHCSSCGRQRRGVLIEPTRSQIMGRIIATLRAATAATQAGFAAKLSIDRSRLARLETGRNTITINDMWICERGLIAASVMLAHGDLFRLMVRAIEKGAESCTPPALERLVARIVDDYVTDARVAALFAAPPVGGGVRRKPVVRQNEQKTRTARAATSRRRRRLPRARGAWRALRRVRVSRTRRGRRGGRAHVRSRLRRTRADAARRRPRLRRLPVLRPQRGRGLSMQAPRPRRRAARAQRRRARRRIAR